ncbi:hypothetical protein EMIT048CA2_40017 [Pseudomonas chlororaphis]
MWTHPACVEWPGLLSRRHGGGFPRTGNPDPLFLRALRELRPVAAQRRAGVCRRGGRRRVLPGQPADPPCHDLRRPHRPCIAGGPRRFCVTGDSLGAGRNAGDPPAFHCPYQSSLLGQRPNLLNTGIAPRSGWEQGLRRAAGGGHHHLASGFPMASAGAGRAFCLPRAGQEAGPKAAHRYWVYAADARGYPRETSISGLKSRGKPYFSNVE